MFVRILSVEPAVPDAAAVPPVAHSTVAAAAGHNIAAEVQTVVAVVQPSAVDFDMTFDYDVAAVHRSVAADRNPLHHPAAAADNTGAAAVVGSDFCNLDHPHFHSIAAVAVVAQGIHQTICWFRQQTHLFRHHCQVAAELIQDQSRHYCQN